MTTPTAYSYIRFSSTKQELGDSLRRQTELSNAYVKQHNLTLDTSLNLKDLGVSAFKKTNAEEGALSVFLDAIKSGKIKTGSYLLVESLDRISRAEVMSALEIFTSIINAGVTIVTLADNQVYSKETIKANWAQLIISISIMSRAHEESLMKAHRVKAAWKARKKNPNGKLITSRCPSWLEATPDKTKFTLKPNAKNIIKRLIKYSMDGMGTNTIAKRLNEEKIPTFTTTKQWCNSMVQRIFEKTALYGEANFSDADPIQNYYPAIITKEEWLRLQASRSGRQHGGGGRRNNEVSSLFSGLLKCGYCGESMRVSGYTEPANKTNPKRHHKYYVCAKGNEGRGCYTPQWKVAEFEHLVLNYLTELDIASLLNENPPDTKLNELRSLKESKEAELVVIHKKIANLVEAVSGGDQPKAVIGAITSLETEALGLNRDLQSLVTQIQEEVVSGQHLQEQHANLTELISVLSRKSGIELFTLRVRLAENLKRIVSKIHVYPAGPFPGLTKDLATGNISVGKYDKTLRYVVIVFRNSNIVRQVHEEKGVSGSVEFSNPHEED